MLHFALTPAYYGMCSTDVYCSKQTGSSSTKETITHHFVTFQSGQKKTVDAAKICGGAENVVKQRNQQTFVNGLLGFITLGIYTPLEACVLLSNNCMSCHRQAISTLLINILLEFPLPVVFCIVIQPLSEGRNNPVRRCLPVEELHYPRRRRWWLH